MGIFFIIAGCFGILSAVVPRSQERRVGWPVRILMIFIGGVFIYAGLQRLGVIRF